MRISDWSSDVCSSDLDLDQLADRAQCETVGRAVGADRLFGGARHPSADRGRTVRHDDPFHAGVRVLAEAPLGALTGVRPRRAPRRWLVDSEAAGPACRGPRPRPARPRWRTGLIRKAVQ